MEKLLDVTAQKNNFAIKFIDFLMLIDLFLFSSGFAGKTGIYILVLGALFLLRIFIKNNYIKIPYDGVILTLCFLFYGIINIINFGYSSNVLSIFIIGVPLFYFTGYYFIDQYKNINYIIIAIALGFILHGILNLVITGEMTNIRNPMDVWSEKMIAATLQNTFFTISSAMLFPALFCSKKLIYKLISIGFFLLGIYNALITNTRTGILLPILVFIFLLIISIIESKNNEKNKRKITIIVLLSVIAAFSLFVIIDEQFLGSEFFNREGNTLIEDPRFVRWEKTLQYMFTYPFGGEILFQKSGGYGHNLWIDLIQNAGIFICLLFLLYNIVSLKILIKVFKNKKVPSITRYLLLAFNLSVYINCAIEEILLGQSIMLLMLFLINGITRKVYDKMEV